MDRQEFFKEHGDLSLKLYTRFYEGSFDGITVEDLYQAIKARLNFELGIDHKVGIDTRIHRISV